MAIPATIQTPNRIQVSAVRLTISQRQAPTDATGNGNWTDVTAPAPANAWVRFWFAPADPIALHVLRVLAGLLEASLFWITTVVIVRSQEPDRLAGIFLTIQTLTQALVMLAIARLPLQFLGWQAGFVVLALVCLLPLSVIQRSPGPTRSGSKFPPG